MNEEEIKRRLIEGITDIYTLNLAISILEELQAYKDKEDKLREELLIWGEVINPTLQNNLLQILNEGSDK